MNSAIRLLLTSSHPEPRPHSGPFQRSEPERELLATMSRALRGVLGFGLMLLAFGLVADAQPAPSPEAADAESVVVAFNRAISERRVDEAAALVADGAVQFGIRPAHAFATSGPGSPCQP